MNNDNSIYNLQTSIVELVDAKLKDMDDYKADLDELTRKQNDIKEKVIPY